MRRSIRVAIVDGHHVFRDRLAELLAFEPDLRVSVFDDHAALAVPGGLQAVDVVLADERLLSAGASAARSALTATAVVVMGMGDPDQYADAAIAAGAVAYWPKYGDIDALLALVRATALVTRLERDGEALAGANARRPAAPQTGARLAWIRSGPDRPSRVSTLSSRR